jgi:hypothetical protein
MNVVNRRRVATAALVAMGWLAVQSGPVLAATVPFHGMDRGEFMIPGDCAGGVQVVIEGVGTATQLGRHGFTSVECFNPGTGSFAGAPRFTAANGDTLTGSYAGTVAGTDDPNVITYQEELAITGGTGRFIGATGTVHVDGIANLATGDYSQWLAGTISGLGSA